MVKHTQTIHRPSVFDHFVGLGLKELRPCEISVSLTVSAKSAHNSFFTESQIHLYKWRKDHLFQDYFKDISISKA